MYYQLLKAFLIAYRLRVQRSFLFWHIYWVPYQHHFENVERESQQQMLRRAPSNMNSIQQHGLPDLKFEIKLNKA